MNYYSAEIFRQNGSRIWVSTEFQDTLKYDQMMKHKVKALFTTIKAKENKSI